MRTVVRCALAAMVFFIIAYALFTSQAVSSSWSVAPGAPISATAADAPSDHRSRSDAATGSIDLYGNEVSDAIATYSLDPGGSLYEVHSPQTELPKLASPKS